MSKRLRPLQLAAVIFLTVSGGPYGLEPLLSYAGRNGALLLLMLVPLLWDIPTILTVMELNSMMPVTGGYYQWVKRALGLRWAFFEGWWTWLYTFVDLAIYPVLFVSYAAFFFPAIAAYKIPVCLVIVWAGAGLNILGIVPVGRTSLVLGAAVLTPFLILFGVFFFGHTGPVSFPVLSLRGIGFSSLGMALYTVMWNFIGWDNATTYAEEVDRPVRSYLVATGIAFVAIFAIYFGAVLVAQESGIDLQQLSEQDFSMLGSFVGGPWLGALIAAGGMASTLGIFSAVLLSVSRIPKVMADDRLLPARLHALHPRFGTPWLSIVVCAVVVSGMILWSFADLLIIDVTLYGTALLLEFISLIVLRFKAPAANRPFKIPLNVAGLCVLVLLPLTVFSIALSAAFMANDKEFIPAVFAVITLLSAEIAWQFIRLFRQYRQRKATPDG